MEASLYILVPLSVLLVFGIAWLFWWSVRSGQFDDMEGPAFRLLMDDDKPPKEVPPEKAERPDGMRME